MLIKMLDGGLVNYSDDCYHHDGCPTCDYGSEYINDIYITLTKYKIHIQINKMYEYAMSEGQMIKLFLTEYNKIRGMKEAEFIGWFKGMLYATVNDDIEEPFIVKVFEVKEMK